MGQGVLINPWKTSGEDKVEEGEGRVERDTWRRLARLSRTDIATTQDGAPSAEGGGRGQNTEIGQKAASEPRHLLIFVQRW